MPLSDLPKEIFFDIADYLNNKETNALARANRHIYSFLNGYLYSRNQTDPDSGIRSVICGAYYGVEGTVQNAIAAARNPLPECYNDALECAIRQGHEHLVKLLLEVDGINQNFIYKEPLIVMAARMGNSAIVKLLLAANIKPNAKDELNQSPLHKACVFGYGSIVKQLLARHDVDVNAGDVLSLTPLHLACKAGHASIVKLLLARNDVKLNVLESSGLSTPLIAACDHRGRGAEVVKLLLAKDGIDVNLRNIDGDTPLMKAITAGSVRAVDSLLARDDLNPNIMNSNGVHVLGHSVFQGCDIVKRLLDRPDIDPNFPARDGRTALMRACREWRDMKVVKLLLDWKGVDVNQRDNSGQTALTLASRHNVIDAVELLLAQNNIEPNIQDNDGMTALSWACKRKCCQVVGLLLQKDDVDPNIRDNSGCTPLVHACLNNRADIVRSLLSRHDTDPNPVNKNGVSVLAEVINNLNVTPRYDREIEDLLRAAGAM
jgi:ankyrin repeat protein